MDNMNIIKLLEKHIRFFNNRFDKIDLLLEDFMNNDIIYLDWVHQRKHLGEQEEKSYFKCEIFPYNTHIDKKTNLNKKENAKYKKILFGNLLKKLRKTRDDFDVVNSSFIIDYLFKGFLDISMKNKNNKTEFKIILPFVIGTNKNKNICNTLSFKITKQIIKKTDEISRLNIHIYPESNIVKLYPELIPNNIDIYFELFRLGFPFIWNYVSDYKLSRAVLPNIDVKLFNSKKLRWKKPQNLDKYINKFYTKQRELVTNKSKLFNNYTNTIDISKINKLLKNTINDIELLIQPYRVPSEFDNIDPTCIYNIFIQFIKTQFTKISPRIFNNYIKNTTHSKVFTYIFTKMRQNICAGNFNLPYTKYGLTMCMLIFGGKIKSKYGENIMDLDYMNLLRNNPKHEYYHVIKYFINYYIITIIGIVSSPDFSKHIENAIFEKIKFQKRKNEWDELYSKLFDN